MKIRTIVTTTLTALIVAPSAFAANGTYEVVACDAAGGANHSWRAQAGNSALFVSRERCPALGIYDGFGMRSSTASLVAPQLSSSWWRFDAPAGTSFEAIEWAGHYSTQGNGWVARIESSRGVVAGCGPSPKACERVWAHGAKPVRYELHGATWLRVGALCGSASGCRTGDGKTTPYVDASTWYAKVLVRDAAAPVVSVAGDPVDYEWVRPGGQIRASAADASGIARMALELDGVEVAVQRFDCDDTKPRPCADRSAGFTLPQSIADGRHSAAITASDAAGNTGRRAFPVAIDSTAPSAQGALKLNGSAGWRDSGSFAVGFTVPQDEGSPIRAVNIAVCPVAIRPAGNDCLPVQHVATTSASGTINVELPCEGEWAATAWFEDSVGNQDRRNSTGPIRLLSDRTAPGPAVMDAPEGWLSRSAAQVVHVGVSMDPAVDPPLSGLAGWSVGIGAMPSGAVDLAGDSVEIPVGQLQEGETVIRVRPIGGSGLVSRSVTSETVRIDETPPSVEISGIPDEQWSTGAVTVVGRGRDQANLSGMGTAAWSNSRVRVGVDANPAVVNPGDQAEVKISVDGVHAIWADATDAAGNPSGRVTGTVRIDSVAPERLAFLPQDQADPRIVRVDASDATSGVAKVTARMRPVAGGAWVNLDGSYADGRFETTIDESKLSVGLWEMETTASDQAGNSKTVRRTINNDPAVVAIPLRRGSRIEAGLRPVASSASIAGTSMTAANGASTQIGGRLVTALDEPLVGAVVELSSAPTMVGGEWSSAGSQVTDHGGRFSFTVPAGPGRKLRISFAGDHGAMPSSQAMSISVPAKTTLAATPARVRSGQLAVFAGRLAGGWVPSGGKLVMVQAMIPGRGWQTFSVARSNSFGEWSAKYRFRTAIGKDGYLIRAVVPVESAYPFGGFTTPSLRIRGAA